MNDARGEAQQGVRMWSAGTGRSGTQDVPSPAEAGATFVVGGTRVRRASGRSRGWEECAMDGRRLTRSAQRAATTGEECGCFL